MGITMIKAKNSDMGSVQFFEPRAVTTELLRELGFVPRLDFGRSKHELNWRGARLWWDGVALRFEGEILLVDSMEQLTEFIRSLNLKPRRGVKTLR